MDSGLAIFMSAILATIGWVTTQRAGRKADRKKHTFEAIKTNRDSEGLNAAISAVRVKRLAGVPPKVSAETASEYTHYNVILTHYEYLCAALITGDLDEELLLRSERSRVIQIEEMFRDYVAFVAKGASEPEKQDTVYENLKYVAGRWRGTRQERSIPHVFIEWMTMRPYQRGQLALYWGQVKTSVKSGMKI